MDIITGLSILSISNSIQKNLKYKATHISLYIFSKD